MELVIVGLELKSGIIIFVCKLNLKSKIYYFSAEMSDSISFYVEYFIFNRKINRTIGAYKKRIVSINASALLA